MNDLHQAAQAALEALEELVAQAPFARYVKITDNLRTALAFTTYSDALDKHRQITNREGVIHMAREAGWTQYSLLHPVEVQRLEHFANLVADAEREAIIQTVNELTDDRHPMFVEGYHLALHHIGQCIEGRGRE